MKFGIYDPYLDDIGGGEKYMMTIAECLSVNHDVDVFWDNPEDLNKINLRFGIDISRIKTAKNIFKLGFIEKQKFSRKYDCIIVLSDGSIPVLASKKTYLHIQQPLLHVGLSIKDKLKLKKINKVFCNSIFTKEFIDEKFGVKSELLYPPVNVYGMGKNKENIIMHVGRFRVVQVNSSDYKKQNVMITAFKEMVDKGLKGWKFIVAVSLENEDNPEFLKMKANAKGYPIEFLINSSNKKLWEVGKKAKIYWHASGYGENLVSNPELAEHFGISTVEAMGVGAVPVVINAGGQKEIVESGIDGYLWNTLDELKDYTLELIENKKLIEEMSTKAFEKSKKFDKENFKINLFRILNV